MSPVYEYLHDVGDDEIDSLGHVNNVAYVEWMQSAAVAHSSALGWSTRAYRLLGAGWVARSHGIEYLQSALAGDRIVVRTWIATMTRVTSIRRYKIVRLSDEQLLATAETKWAFIDFATGRPVRIPPEVSQSFEGAL